uniref:DUF4371 domain-containing protein n=1 Tax=Latimeria chalumnae TaxID=7897 RepID=H3A0B7_LATCH
MSCGRTKAELLVTNVMAPKFVRDCLQDLLPSPPEQPVYFSVATDASNKGNRKMFPMCLRYFTISDGVQCKLLDFYEDSDESASGIHRAVKNYLEKHQLSINCITAYSADNALVNYGKHNSVYQLLCAENDRILKANCPAHVAHNTCKHASDQLSVDIDMTVLKIYSHFSVSAKHREKLRNFFEFVEIEWKEVLRHVSTRWLSLNPAVDQLLRNWPAITAYFKSLGESCPVALKKIFTEDGEYTCIVEIYMCFFHNVACVFDELVNKLEESKLCITDVYTEMYRFKMKMLNRKEDCFFGFQAKQLMGKLLPEQKLKLKKDFITF